MTTETTEGSEAPPSAIATFFPGYFALVMATGIIAIGAHLAGPRLARRRALCRRRARLCRHRRADDAAARPLPAPAPDRPHEPRPGFAFLTAVAATNVLGSASAIVHGWWGLAWVLWFTGIALWAILLYVTLIAVVIRSPQARSRGGHQRHLVPAHRRHRIDRRAGRAAARARRQRSAGLHLPGAVLPRARAVPDRHDHGLPAVDLRGARAHRGRSPRVDRRRCRRHHRPRRIEPAARPGRRAAHRAASPRPSRCWSCWRGPPPPSGSRS